MAQFETVNYEKEGHLATITLNRPQTLNSFNIQMRDDIFEVLSAIKEDDEVYGVVIKGAGDRAFCAGADLSEFLTAPSPIIARQVRFQRDVWGLFATIKQPIIAALHGYVLGSGIEIALFCDIRIASEDAQFGLPETALGLIPAAGGSQTVPRTIGNTRAMELLLTNRWISADEAFQAGLVNQVVPAEDLAKTVENLAKKIVNFEPMAVQSAKQAVKRGMDLSLIEGLELENRLAINLI